MKETKKWYQSKTKVGILLGGLGALLTTVGAYFGGALSLAAAIPAIITELGVILTVFGIRDAL